MLTTLESLSNPMNSKGAPCSLLECGPPRLHSTSAVRFRRVAKQDLKTKKGVLTELGPERLTRIWQSTTVAIKSKVVQEFPTRVKVVWLPLADATGDVLKPEGTSPLVVPRDEIQELRHQEVHPLEPKRGKVQSPGNAPRVEKSQKKNVGMLLRAG